LPLLDSTNSSAASAQIEFEVPTAYDGQLSVVVSAPAGTFNATTPNCTMASVLDPVADSLLLNVSVASAGLEAIVDPCGKCRCLLFVWLFFFLLSFPAPLPQ
jgi:hypothetical protein